MRHVREIQFGVGREKEKVKRTIIESSKCLICTYLINRKREEMLSSEIFEMEIDINLLLMGRIRVLNESALSSLL